MDQLNNTNTKSFTDYLLKEYSIISEAHFKTIETISAFFKNYLILMTLPVTLAAAIIGLSKNSPDIPNIINSLPNFAGYVLMIISLIGIFVLLYIINLRLDAILYARSINSMRKYFYEELTDDIIFSNRFRNLPQSSSLPLYFEGYYFSPVVIAFGLFNGFYCSVGFKIILQNIKSINSINVDINFGALLLIILPIITIFHLILYKCYTIHREFGYLKSNIIGIDIDGVLNKHREHFCELYNKIGKNKIKPEDIIEIPVHEVKGLNVTETEEKIVFNNPFYWTGMPVNGNVSKNLRKLKNVFKFELMIFTYRPWPDNSYLDKQDKLKLLKKWRQSLNDYELTYYIKKDLSTKLIFLIKYLIVFKNIFKNFFNFKNIINKITKKWLKMNEIPFNNLVIEKGNEHVTDSRGNFRNRFIISKKRKIKYFVEDDLEKAIKLSFICDYVFLIEHPYNKLLTKVPKNIITVDSWEGIYKKMKSLS